MSNLLGHWNRQSKTVQLLDLTSISLFILAIVSGFLYKFILEEFVQNLGPLFLCLILAMVTFGTRLKITHTDNETYIRNYLIEWAGASVILILIAFIIMFFYPLGRNIGA